MAFLKSAIADLKAIKVKRVGFSGWGPETGKKFEVTIITGKGMEIVIDVTASSGPFYVHNIDSLEGERSYRGLQAIALANIIRPQVLAEIEKM